jgi:hypothetical protein
MNPRMKKTDEVILKIDMDERKLMVLFWKKNIKMEIIDDVVLKINMHK